MLSANWTVPMVSKRIIEARVAKSVSTRNGEWPFEDSHANRAINLL